MRASSPATAVGSCVSMTSSRPARREHPAHQRRVGGVVVDDHHRAVGRRVSTPSSALGTGHDQDLRAVGWSIHARTSPTSTGFVSTASAPMRLEPAPQAGRGVGGDHDDGDPVRASAARTSRASTTSPGMSGGAGRGTPGRSAPLRPRQTGRACPLGPQHDLRPQCGDPPPSGGCWSGCPRCRARAPARGRLGRVPGRSDGVRRRHGGRREDETEHAARAAESTSPRGDRSSIRASPWLSVRPIPVPSTDVSRRRAGRRARRRRES